MGPSSEKYILQGPAHNLDTGHKSPHESATGLSDNIVLAAPYQLLCSIQYINVLISIDVLHPF